MSRHDLRYEFCGLTDQGRTRGNNEDSVVVLPDVGLAVLADGMGGYNAGEVASTMTSRHLADELGRWLADAGRLASAREMRRALELCVANANHAVFEAAQSHPQYEGMGTTLVVGVFHPQRLLIGHIGDSRAYRLREGELVQITRDHSLMQEQMDAGLITPAEAAVSGQRNLVTRAVGVEPLVQLEVNEHGVQRGDCYLLCSDGLSDMVDDATIADLLRQPAPLGERAAALVAQANAQGGRDNISVVLAQAGAGPVRRGLLARWLGP